VPAQVEIGLVSSGDIEGAIVKNGGLGFEGVDLELLDPSGSVVSTARTDYDGYFLFEGIPYGTYRVRIAKSSAEAMGVGQDLKLQTTVDDQHPVARLGTTQLQPQPKIASSQ
jgi:hypothetical protein